MTTSKINAPYDSLSRNDKVIKGKRQRVLAPKIDNSDEAISKRRKPSEAIQPPKQKTEFITKEQLKEHILSLSQKPDECETFGDENYDICSLCKMSRLFLAPQVKFCSHCGSIIKRNGNYFSTAPNEDEDSNMCFCTTCYNHSRGEIRPSQGKSVAKSELYSLKNCDDTEELWVQCDTCHEWMHQICGLFNTDRDSDENSEFKCPKCRLKKMENGDYKPSPDDSFVSAKNLPRTALSNHIEERLSRCLRQEREERANAQGKPFAEVQGVEDISVRVVLSMKKNFEVNKKLLSIIQDKNHPTQFTYTSKLILLFQKLDGIDVCLFAMYVQEYGSESDQPNQRCAYISYLDSVKYFKPNIVSSSGEALRTVVYHELLISYMDYIKRRGFARSYLWSCPPEKGDDYVLYCHPETQKTPTPNRLRHWYHAMLKKAATEGIAVHRSTFYDRYFVEKNCKSTVARLPYFDGDYWTGVVENLAVDIEKQIEKQVEKPVTKTSLKVMGLKSAHDSHNKDILLMKKIGEAILPLKEDFMVIDLQYVCTSCHKSILSGKRWYCKDDKKWHLCERCHSQKSHISSKVKDKLSQAFVNVPSDTIDEDGVLESEICNSRENLLNFFKDRSHQFNTVRRAKHSSMMLLYNLLRETCRVCHKEIIGQRLSCEICPKYSVCSPCYQQHGSSCHVHNMRPKEKVRVALSEQEQVELLKIIRHVCECLGTKETQCTFRGCKLVKGMFRHLGTCGVRADGGCLVCHKVWYALKLHSRQCRERLCSVPFCNDLKMQEQTS